MRRRVRLQHRGTAAQQRAHRAIARSRWDLDWTDRTALYERIDRRVDLMFAAGLLAEAERVWHDASRPHGVAGDWI